MRLNDSDLSRISQGGAKGERPVGGSNKPSHQYYHKAAQPEKNGKKLII